MARNYERTISLTLIALLNPPPPGGGGAKGDGGGGHEEQELAAALPLRQLRCHLPLAGEDQEPNAERRRLRLGRRRRRYDPLGSGVDRFSPDRPGGSRCAGGRRACGP
ncbi:hypothetical protein EOD43_02725 [Sphingomonas crocodyli]|uniref:Uncharacterized protein n=1 Tax=Sphingomonas crocodyli TaxID=1979270 RepID=A0A437M5M9_9SPHN|nr:hypothetical protein EOD43_02725 [Sphingomonas crocodyli]